jgi:SAM-dependent methyltransferase
MRQHEHTAQCTVCQRQYPIERGVLRLLDDAAADDFSAHEQHLWDLGAADYDNHVTDGRTLLNAMEIPATLRALKDIAEASVLELGCGTGRLTVHMANACRELVAVDFSGSELSILAQKLPTEAPVSLVQADVSRPLAASRAFDVIVSSQVVQALPSRHHRMAMFRWASEALSDSGRFVFTTYHHGLRNRVFGIARSARYREGGIYRYYSTVAELKREVLPYFESVRIRPIQVVIPGTGRLRIPPVALSRAAERIPVLKQLGILLLVEAQLPHRTPAEGDPSMAVEGGVTLIRRRLERVRERRRAADSR